MRHHKLFYGSSYDRGLDILLFMWPDIKEKYPDAELHIAYGWDLFDKGYRTNPERMSWKRNVEQMMNQEGIHHYGRVGKKELREIRSNCGIWAYPTYFEEINCITALESQRDGLVPVTMSLAALNETVGSGVKIDGNIQDFNVQEQYLSKLLELMGNAEKWKYESKKAKEFARNYDWNKMASAWVQEFETSNKTPKVSVITVTNREGWWGSMAANLSSQTYTDFEWVIVDDHKQDRSEIAKRYAEAYDLDIKYVRGDKASGKYDKPYGLVRANNLGWKTAVGELLVWVQDFIYLPLNGIERLVDVYNHHPNAIIAPTDVYYHTSKPNFNNKEDWWAENEKLFTTVSWKNIRNQYKGLRDTDNPMDFEMNYSATPKKIVEHLNGWWEFFDQTIGYDNTEFAYRALKAGYQILIDDSNVAHCADLDEYILHTHKGHEAKVLFDQLVERMDNGEITEIRKEAEDK